MRPRWWTLTGTLAAALAAAAGGAWWVLRTVADRTIRSELAAARDERAARRPGAAATRLARLEARWPGRADVAFETGVTELARGRVEPALDALARVTPGSPQAGRAALLRSQVEIRRGQFDAAETLLTRTLDHPAFQRDPSRLDVRDALLRLLRSEGRFAEARRLFLDGFDDWPDPIAALRALYRLDVDPYAVEGIKVYLDNAARRAPDDDRVWLALAYLAARLGRFDEAERRLDACQKRRPDDPAVWRARLDWARAADRPDAVRTALVHLPADPIEAEELRAWFAARRGDLAGERRALERRLELDPGHIASLNRLAELAVRSGQPEEAKRYHEREDEVNRAREAYRTLLASPDPKSQAGELAKRAAQLGLAFESRRWAALGGRPPPPARPESARGRTLADLTSDLTPGVTAERTGTRGDRLTVAFVDDAESSGLRFTHDNGAAGDAKRLIPPTSACGGVGLLDYDGDGWLDVYCVQGGAFPPDPAPTAAAGDRLFRNRGNGTFEDVTGPSGLAPLLRGYGHGVAVGDYDNDGHPDLFVTRWRAYALYRNRGDGTFEDMTERAHLGGDRDWPTSAAFADLDNDGDLDLYVCHYFRWDETNDRTCSDPDDPSKYRCIPRMFEALPDHVFRNDGGRFVDVSAEAGIVDRDGRGFGVVAADLDGDHRIDLYVANDMTANYLFRNLGGFRFEETAVAAGAAANGEGAYQAGMGVASGDLDGDGRPDLVVTNYYNESTTFFGNLGQGLFADRTAAIGLAAPSRFRLGFGVVLPDVNNDGRLDLLTANGHIHDGRPQFPYRMRLQLCLGTEGGRVVDATDSAGAPFQAELLGRGLAAGDLDNDGRVDALVLSQGDPLILLHNRTERPGHFVTLRLEGRTSNRDGVGAEVTVHAGGRRHVAQRVGGGSYQSADDPRLHFGLGDARTIDAVEVRWPSGRVDRHERLDADRGYRIREGDARPGALEGFTTPPAPPRTTPHNDTERQARP